jgi:hypothetical protein
VTTLLSAALSILFIFVVMGGTIVFLLPVLAIFSILMLIAALCLEKTNGRGKA